MTIKIVVLGSGPGGYIAALKGAQSGASVTVIENDRIGGVCLNRGCIPTKTLKASADAADTSHRLSEFGLSLKGTVEVDMKAILERRERVSQTMATGISSLFKRYGVRLIHGRGQLTSPRSVEVALADGTTETVPADRIIIATGSKIRNLPGLEIDGTRVISSDDALMLDSIPSDMLIVGGGVIGCELASIFRALGSRITIVEAMDRLLPIPSIDHEISRIFQREMKKRKITFHLQQTIDTLETIENDRIRVQLTSMPEARALKNPVLEVGKVLVTVGRQCNSAGIGLKQAAIQVAGDGSIPVDDYLQTNVEGVYAIGDVLGPSRIMLAHVASAEGIVAIRNCLGEAKKMSYAVVPSGIFASPEIAAVGLSESQAKDQYPDCRVGTFNFRGLGKSQAMGELAGLVKIISINDASGTILGAHIIGAHATDLIGEVALAMEAGVGARQLAKTIHLHPALSEGVMEAAHAVFNKCLHLPPVPN